MAKIGSVEVSEKMIQDALAARAEGTGYTGAGDNLIDFGSASSFVDEDSSAKRFSLKITNKSEADELVQLNEIIAAINGASVIKEGEIKTNLTAKGSPRSIELLKNYIGENPTRLRSIKLNVDNVEQLDQPLRYITETPFKTGVEEERIPSNYQSQDTNNPLMTEVSDVKDWVLSRFSTVAFKVGAGRTVNLSILFGAGIDLKKALDNKATAAKDNGRQKSMDIKLQKILFCPLKNFGIAKITVGERNKGGMVHYCITSITLEMFEKE